MEGTGIINAFKMGGVEITKFQASLTCSSSLQGVSISLVRKVSPESLEIVSDVLLMNMLKYVSVGKTFEPEMLPLIQHSIFKKYYYLTLEEYAYVLRMGAAGEYGKIYDRIDLNVIMNWFEIYDTKERMAVVSKAKHNESVELNKAIDGSMKLIGASEKFIEEFVKPLVEDLNKSVEEERQKEIDYQKFKIDQLKQGKIINNKNLRDE